MKVELQPLVRDAEGRFHLDLSEGGLVPNIIKTPLRPVVRTTFATWADSLIWRGQDAIDYGFGMCNDGVEPYDLYNFLCDTHGGAIPWDNARCKALFAEMLVHPKFHQVMDDFEAKYGDVYFPKTWAGMCYED